MVMKVENTNRIMYQSSSAVTKPDGMYSKTQQTNGSEAKGPDFQREKIQLPNTVAEYTIKTPQNYKKLGVTEFAGGLKLHSYKLANGHRISIVPMEGSPAIVKNYVNVGSMNETDNIKGISHFLEHMAFNGTTGENGYIKLEQGDSFKKIDKLGGWINASTNYAVTDYVNSTPILEDKDVEEQVKIIAAMTEDLALTPEMIEKEKGPVCSEINMILDSPETILMDQTVRSLFNIKSSADELVGGSTKHIMNLTREDVKAYYDKYYTPDNMNLVITGDVEPDKIIETVAKSFHSKKSSSGKKYEEKLSPINKTIRKDFISDKADSASIMLGFAFAPNNDSKSRIIYEILDSYIHSTEIGLDKELKDINAYSGMYKEKISNNPYAPTMLCFSADCADINSEKALKIILNKLSNLKAPSEEKLENIKEDLLLAYKNGTEYSGNINSIIGNNILNNTLDYAVNYENLIKEITTQDIQNYIDKYLDLNKTAITVVHPEITPEEILENYNKASMISFKGNRLPVDATKISEQKLNNNYKLGFYETNNDNISFRIKLRYDLPENISPAVNKVLNEILDSGTTNKDETTFLKELEDNNIDVYSSLSLQSYSVYGTSSFDKFDKTINLAKELFYAPRITQEEVDSAILRIKDSLYRSGDSSYSIYSEQESKINPLYISKERLLKELDNVTVDDVKALHQYILKNSVGTISINSPKNKDIKSIAVNEFERLKAVSPYRNNIKNVYKNNDGTKVLTKEKPVSQADILQAFKYEFVDTPKEIALTDIMNTLLSSSSIGLFNTLREKEHLAYSVYSDTNRVGNCGELFCNILTTTDNKETCEKSFENVQKSINGFNRQITALINSEYTDDDLESAKRISKATLLNNEGTDSKLHTLTKLMEDDKGLDYKNQIYNEIDNITREDIKNFAEKVFKNPPTYSIVASKDTLEANKDFFETLESV